MYYYTPFRNTYNGKKSDTECVFCNKKMMASQSVKHPGGLAVETRSYRWIINIYPKFEGHTMVVPKKHITEIGAETEREINEREKLFAVASRTLQALYPGAGVEIFLQTGPGFESSIKHLHWHIVPSLPQDPLRGFDKLGHFFTMEKEKAKILVFPVPVRLARNQLLRALTRTLGKEDRNEGRRYGGRKGN
jgi:diadenosine tetraphosphate (Ap4A) HIT family hydrolase